MENKYLQKIYKIIILVIMILALFSFYFTYNAFADDEEKYAVQITDVQAYDEKGSINADALADDNIYTKVRFSEVTSVSFTSQSDIKAIYLIFDGPLKGYTLSYGDYILKSDKDGFLHDFKQLYTNVNSLTIEFNAGTVLTDVYFFSEGEVPEWVQRWENPLEKADMLVLPTHHDDEILFFGGTMPVYSLEKGKKVQVAYMNNHWGEPYRPHEALNGLWTSGIRNYPIIPDFNDTKFYDLEGALNYYGEDALQEYYVSLIRRFKPEVIIAHDFNGEYGHGSHMASAYSVAKAIELAKNSESFLSSANTYGVWEVKKAYFHLYQENKIVMEWDQPLQEFGEKTGFDVAVDALNCHQSQLKYYSMSKRGVYDCRQFGLYYSAVGEDVEKNDFFENIPEYQAVVDQSLISEVVLPKDTLVAEESIDNSVPNPCFNCEVPDKKNSDYVFVIAVASGICALALIIALIIYKGRKK